MKITKKPPRKIMKLNIRGWSSSLNRKAKAVNALKLTVSSFTVSALPRGNNAILVAYVYAAITK